MWIKGVKYTNVATHNFTRKRQDIARPVRSSIICAGVHKIYILKNAIQYAKNTQNKTVLSLNPNKGNVNFIITRKYRWEFQSNEQIIVKTQLR